MGCKETRNYYKACREVLSLFQPSFPHWMVLVLCPSLTFLCYIRNKHFLLTFDGKNRAWRAPERLFWGCRSNLSFETSEHPQVSKADLSCCFTSTENFLSVSYWRTEVCLGLVFNSVIELVLKHRGLCLCLGSERSHIGMYEKTTYLKSKSGDCSANITLNPRVVECGVLSVCLIIPH